MDGCPVLRANTQCPQKPRGRKKNNVDAATTPLETEDVAKAHEKKRKSQKANQELTPDSIPSAAACGFSTEGLTLAEIMAKLGHKTALAEQANKKASHGKKTNKRDAKDVEEGTKDEIPSKMLKAAKINTETKTHRRKRPSDAAEPDNAESKPATCSGKRLRKGKASGGKSDKHDAAAAPIATTANTAEASAPAPTDKPDPKALAKAETKARCSRKSAAYHRAAAAAKKKGATPEQIKAAAKEASGI